MSLNSVQVQFRSIEFGTNEFGSSSGTIRVEFELGPFCVNDVWVSLVSVRVKFGWGQLWAKLIRVGLGGGQVKVCSCKLRGWVQVNFGLVEIGSS